VTRIAALLVVGALISAACGDDDDEPAATDVPVVETEAPPATDAPPATEAPPATDAPPETEAPPETDPPMPDMVTVTSPDGQLTIEVDGADAQRFNPSISILDPSQWPEAIAGGANLPGVTVYQIEPAGAEFDSSVTVIREIEAAAVPGAGPSDVPLVVLFTQDESGHFRPLGDPIVTSFGDALQASGTTVHGGLIGTLSLGSVVSVDGLAPVAAPPTIGEADFASVPVVATDEIDAVGGVLPTVVAPGFENREPQPTASPASLMAVSEIDGDPPVTLYNIETEAVNVPTPTGFFGDPQLDVPAELSLTVILFIAAVEGGNSEDASRLEALADALAQGAGLQWSVTHTPFGGRYPSFARAEFSGISQLADGDNLYLLRYVGPPDATAQVIDIAQLQPNGANYAADAGLVSFGPVQDAVLAVAGELPVDLVDGDPSPFWQFNSEQTDIPMQVFTVIDTATGEILVHDVGPAEGVVFSGDVGFEPFPIP
jgi:hypothetical protein